MHFKVIFKIFSDLKLEFVFYFFLFQVCIYRCHLIPQFALDLLHVPENFTNLGDGISEEHTCKQNEEHAVDLFIFVLGSDVSVPNCECGDCTPIKRGDVSLKNRFFHKIESDEPNIGKSTLNLPISNIIKATAKEVAHENNDKHQLDKVNDGGPLGPEVPFCLDIFSQIGGLPGEEINLNQAKSNVIVPKYEQSQNDAIIANLSLEVINEYLFPLVMNFSLLVIG